VIASQGYVSETSDYEVAAAGLRIRRVWTLPLAKKTTVRRYAAYMTFLVAAGNQVLRLPAQDIVICLTTPPFIELLGVLHKRLHPQARLVLWCMDCYPEAAERAGVIKPGGVISRLLRRLNRRTTRRLDHVVCLDDAMSSLMQARCSSNGSLERSISVVPNWEPLEAFSSPPAVGLRNPDQPTRIIYSGNMGHGHCFDTVIEAAERLRGEAVDFLFTGGGAKAAEIKQAIDQRRLGNVHLFGYVSPAKLRELQESADCALITLRAEMAGVVSPSKLHASLAMGLPILYVGPRGSNVDHAIGKHGCGLSLRNGDVDRFVGFVRRLRRAPAAHRALRVKARVAFEAEYNDVVSLAKFDRILDSLAFPTKEVLPRRAA
jgi:glycosyltransferase involved in cell wall biosynthesis